MIWIVQKIIMIVKSKFKINKIKSNRFIWRKRSSSSRSTKTQIMLVDAIATLMIVLALTVQTFALTADSSRQMNSSPKVSIELSTVDMTTILVVR